MNRLFDEEIRPLHSMRDHLLTVVTDADLDKEITGRNPTLGGLLVEMGDLQGVYMGRRNRMKVAAWYLARSDRAGYRHGTAAPICARRHQRVSSCSRDMVRRTRCR